MAASLWSPPLSLPLSLRLLLLPLLMSLLPLTAPDRAGVSWGRSAEYYQQRYRGRPRRGPLPTTTSSSAEASLGWRQDDSQRHGSAGTALHLDPSELSGGSGWSDAEAAAEAEVSILHWGHLGALEVNSATPAREQDGRDMRQAAAAAGENRSTEAGGRVAVRRNPLGSNSGLRQADSANHTGSASQADSASYADSESHKGSASHADSTSHTAERLSSSAAVNNNVDGIVTGAETETSSGWPQHKFVRLPLLTLLRFSNDACGSEAGGGRGTCLLPAECSRHGGTPALRCAHGFGVCCVLTETCGGATSANNTYFVNPEYPAAGRAVRSCVLTVHKAAADVTQIRLDLTEFQMAGPTGGTCKRDVFSVSGQDINSLVPPLCGRNDGQHLYLEVGERTGPVQLRVVTSSTAGHRWRVRVSQLQRTAAGRAPPLCLQYHTGRTGRISSFNYLPAAQPGRPADGGGYTNNLNYMICMRKESGFCSITYSTDNFRLQPMANQFNIVNFLEDDDSDGGIDPRIVAAAGGSLVPTVPAGQAGVGPIKCRHDYLVLSVDRLCGDRLNDAAASSTLTDNADVTDRSAGQFAVRFVSGRQRTGSGFRLNFRQNPCTSQQVT